MIDTEDAEDAQRPWLVGPEVLEEDIKAAVLFGPPGSFLIQKQDDKSFVLTINAGGEAVTIPVTFGLRAGSKCYMLGDVAHPTLESLVASLAVEGVLAELTGGQVAAKIRPLVAPRPKKGAAAEDEGGDEGSYLTEQGSCVPSFACGEGEDDEDDESDDADDGDDANAGDDADEGAGAGDEAGDAAVEMRNKGGASKKSRPKTRLEIVDEEIHAAKKKILKAFKDHNSNVQDFMNVKLEEEVLGNRKNIKQKRVKHNTKDLKAILASVDKEEAEVFASGTSCKAVKPKSRVYLASKAGEALDLIMHEPIPRGLWLGRNAKGKLGFIRTEDFMISPTDVHKMMHGAFSPAVSPVKLPNGGTGGATPAPAVSATDQIQALIGKDNATKASPSLAAAPHYKRPTPAAVAAPPAGQGNMAGAGDGEGNTEVVASDGAPARAPPAPRRESSLSPDKAKAGGPPPPKRQSSLGPPRQAPQAPQRGSSLASPKTSAGAPPPPTRSGSSLSARRTSTASVMSEDMYGSTSEEEDD